VVENGQPRTGYIVVRGEEELSQHFLTRSQARAWLRVFLAAHQGIAEDDLTVLVLPAQSPLGYRQAASAFLAD
jgi:hypothetical protein